MIASSRLESTGVADRLTGVRARIAEAARRAGRSADTITLVAVSKAFGVERIIEASHAGHLEFGESRAQELRDKAREAGEGIRWHFVGRLQRNKVKHVVGVADLIHSIDREDLATDVAERAARRGHAQPVLLQVNVGRDPAKAGFEAADLEEVVMGLRELDGVSCRGLMTIPPIDVDPRPMFALLRDARDALRERFPEVEHLSMGMSSDFEIAVEEGATIVRLGEAVFGPRPQPA